jgi:hypothetical protein
MKPLMLRQFTIFLIGCAFSTSLLNASTLLVGPGQPYANPQQAAGAAQPGDTILITVGEYRGTYWIENLKGTESAPIVIRGVDSAMVRFVGGTESMHFSDCAYLVIENMTVTGQTGNGMNIDDGGSFETPTHHIVIRSVAFDSMNASGNNDMLKLSGLDDFEITNCSFTRGAAGGSGIDMVGCHRGRIVGNTFTSLGSNAIQAKGGTQFIAILRNSFTNAGQLAVNLGGSTGLQFFRPLDAPFEAADLFVGANIFRGSVAPIAYVGCTRVAVINNTIIDPERWVFRILQETVDPTRFVVCGNNIFANNIVIHTSGIATQVNIGSNTDPASFTLQNNLWYNSSDPSRSQWSSPQLTQSASLYGLDPQLSLQLQPSSTSPCRGQGVILTQWEPLTHDRYRRPFGVPPSIGAVEIDGPTSVSNCEPQSSHPPLAPGTYTGVAFDVMGRMVNGVRVTVDETVRVDEHATVPNGPWWVVVQVDGRTVVVPMFRKP